jgi:hypothetical protein
MTKLTKENVAEWTRAKAMEVARFAEEELGVDDLASRLVLKISAKRWACSRGGIKPVKGRVQPWTSLNLGYFAQPLYTGKPIRFPEYKSIENHPVIGSIPACTAEAAITTLIVHEMAHVIDYFTIQKFGASERVAKSVDSRLDMSHSWADRRHRSVGGHGARWQAIYALLRIKFVNNGVTDPVIAESQPKPGRVVRRRAPANHTIKANRVHFPSGRYMVQYLYNGEIVAVGRPRGDWFAIYDIFGDCVHELADGRGARRWVRENMI